MNDCYDGTGADATANDGIYTAYYTHYNGDGRYAIDIGVDSSGNAVTPAILPSNRLGASHFPYFPPGLCSSLSPSAL